MAEHSVKDLERHFPNLPTKSRTKQKLGWRIRGNLQIDYRFAVAGAQAQALAKELVALQPDVIFAMPTPAVAALQRESLFALTPEAFAEILGVSRETLERLRAFVRQQRSNDILEFIVEGGSRSEIADGLTIQRKRRRTITQRIAAMGRQTRIALRATPK